MDYHIRNCTKQQLPRKPPNQVDTTNATKNNLYNITHRIQKQHQVGDIHIPIPTNQENHKPLQAAYRLLCHRKKTIYIYIYIYALLTTIRTTLILYAAL